MSFLVLVRHGQTQYNIDRKFCGWADEPLSELGRKTGYKLGQSLADYHFDSAYSSDLSRSIETAEIILKKLGQKELLINHQPEIKERDYGELTGRTHQMTEKRYGKKQVSLWRRSWDATPPGGESLRDVYNRVIPFFQTKILPKLINNKNVLIVAHGNSLRVLLKHLDNLSDNDVTKLEILYDQAYIYSVTEKKTEKLDTNPRQFQEMAK